VETNELLIGFILGIASSLTVNAMTDWMAVLAKAFTYSKKYTDSQIAQIEKNIEWQRIFLLLFTISAPCYLISVIYRYFKNGTNDILIDIIILPFIILCLVIVLYVLKRSLTILEKHS
jgi:hypothetical protein